jgi:hypothetical protein
MVIQDHRNFNTRGIKKIDLINVNLKMFKVLCLDGGLVFPQINNPTIPYAIAQVLTK